MLRYAILTFTMVLLVSAEDSDSAKYAMMAKDRFQDVANAFSDTPSINPTLLTTFEGQKRLLEERKVIYPPGILSPNAMAGTLPDGRGVMDRGGFPWSSHDFLDGPEENARMLDGFEKLFIEKTGAQPPDWNGLEFALDDPDNLRAAMDLSLAYIKNYELDRCEVLLGRYALPVIRIRGMPWIVKGLQDYATLKMKQNRQAEALVLLEELEAMLPPDPIMLDNLGLVYNSLGMHDKAMHVFEKAVALKHGNMDYDDYWNFGITLKRKENYEGAFEYLVKGLELASADPEMDPITLAKITDDVGNCLQIAAEQKHVTEDERRSLVKEAETYLRDSVELYRAAAGDKHHLYGGSCHLLAKNLIAQGRESEGEPLLYEAMWVETLKNGVHPTPLFFMVEEVIDLHRQGHLPKDQLPKYNDLMRVMLMHLYSRGFCADGNGGVMMQIVARFLLLSEQELVRPALALLRQGLKLVKTQSTDLVEEYAIGYIGMAISADIQRAESILDLAPAGDTPMQPERWLFDGPWGMPAGADDAFGIPVVLELPSR